ncbi:MAG: cell division protein FtsL [Pseudomonadota bacterium]
MKALLFLVSAAMVMALATWAYNENYQTQALLRQIEDLNAEIAADRETLSVLRAELAWLSRPERLRDLVELNYDRLGLLPLSPEHFGRADQIARPTEATRTYLLATQEPAQ